MGVARCMWKCGRNLGLQASWLLGCGLLDDVVDFTLVVLFDVVVVLEVVLLEVVELVVVLLEVVELVVVVLEVVVLELEVVVDDMTVTVEVPSQDTEQVSSVQHEY